MKLYVMTAVPFSELRQHKLEQRFALSEKKRKTSKSNKSAQEGCISTKEHCLERAAEYDPKVWRVTIRKCKGVGNNFQKKIPIRYLKPQKRNF